jgi:anti-sigma regulatory factor (Ser/Thr protein kinase)
MHQDRAQSQDAVWRTLLAFDLSSEPGNERRAMDRVAQSVETLELPPARLERLKTAVAETVLNAIEHGNRYQPDLLVSIQVLAAEHRLMVRVTDQGNGGPITAPAAPNLEAKLAGQESPRGWGFFLIREFVDELQIRNQASHHTVELILYLKETEDDGDRS